MDVFDSISDNELITVSGADFVSDSDIEFFSLDSDVLDHIDSTLTSLNSLFIAFVVFIVSYLLYSIVKHIVYDLF